MPANTGSTYADVCIFCAMAEEALEVIDVFSQRCNVEFQQGFNTHNREYRYATIPNNQGESLTIHVSWPPKYGPVEASLHLHEILSEFRPRFAAMTGICAGDKKEAKLGDLVIADRAFTYDSGKIVVGEDGQSEHLLDIETRGPDTTSLQYAQIFSTWKDSVAELKRPISKRQQHDWLLSKLLEDTTPRVDDIVPQELDTHAPNWRKIVSELQKGDSPYLTADRTIRDTTKVHALRYGGEKFPFTDPSDPECRIGPMASGSAVRRDDPFAGVQMVVYKTIAIDMEGAAFYRAVADFLDIRSLLVKGVADCADTDKDDSYHKYAAAASATYMLCFIKEYVTFNRMPRLVPEMKQTQDETSILLNLTTTLLRRAADEGLDAVGKQLCTTSWWSIKQVLTPVIDALVQRYPNLWHRPEEMDQAMRDVLEDLSLRVILRDHMTELPSESATSILKFLVEHDEETLVPFRNLIRTSLQEAGQRNQAPHERVAADFGKVNTAIVGLPELLAKLVAPAHLSIDEIYRKANNYQQDAMKRILVRDADTASERLAAGRALALSGLSREPDNAKMLVTLGYLEKSQAQVSTLCNDPEGAGHNLALAAKYFANALQLDRTNLSALNGMANVYYFGHDYDSAIQLGFAVVQADPTYGPALNDLAQALEDKMKVIGPEPNVVRGLVAVYEVLVRLTPQQPQIFTARHLDHFQRRLAELREQTPAQTVSLHDAVRNNNLSEVMRLVREGNDTNVKDENENTPLHLAAQKGHKAIAEFIIANGAKVDAKGEGEYTPLCWAARRGHKTVAELLINKGATVNANDIFGVTPLHWAAYNELSDLVELFIAKGANVNAKDKNGNTPLHLVEGNAEVIALLRQHGAEE